MKLNLSLADISSSIDTERPFSHHSTTSRIASKRGLDPAVIQSCLQSLDVFRDLLEGIPHQKNRVVRDVCKNIQLTYFREGDTIYNVGQKANAVYFCIIGTVSICIPKSVPVIKQPSKQQNNQTLTNLPQQKSFRNQQSNNQKNAQNSSNPQPTQSPSNSQQVVEQMQIIDQQVDCIQGGQGFGQAEFISQTKRAVKAVAKQSTTIGKLQIEHFTQVLQNYKQRVYYKKRDMFQRCALFANLPINKLQFIINNTKPMTINISHMLVRQGSLVDTIYLVNKGQVSLWKKGISCQQSDSENSSDQENQSAKNQKLARSKLLKNSNNLSNLNSSKIKSNNSLNKYKVLGSEQQQQETTELSPENLLSAKSQEIINKSKIFSSALKLRSEKSPLPQQKDHKVFVGQLSQGCFLGDMQLVLGTQFKYNALCRTQKAEVYYCDRRIILSQMSAENLQQAQKYYKQKQAFINKKIRRYRHAKQKIEKQQKIDLLPPLTKDQIKLKRKIMHRYVQQKHSLIGQSSPSDIQKMIKRKQLRVKKQPEISRFPILQLFPSHSVKKRSQSPLLSPRSFNPLSLVQVPGRKCITEFDQYNLDEEKKPDVKQNGRLRRMRRNATEIQRQNPQQNKQQSLKKLKSVMIKIKPSRLDLSDLKYGQGKNMAMVSQILGRYKKCQNKFAAINDIISKIENNRT